MSYSNLDAKAAAVKRIEKRFYSACEAEGVNTDIVDNVWTDSHFTLLDNMPDPVRAAKPWTEDANDNILSNCLPGDVFKVWAIVRDVSRRQHGGTARLSFPTFDEHGFPGVFSATISDRVSVEVVPSQMNRWPNGFCELFISCAPGTQPEAVSQP